MFFLITVATYCTYYIIIYVHNYIIYIIRKEPARVRSRHMRSMKLIGWVRSMFLWKVVSEQGVKTRSREGVAVTDAGKGTTQHIVMCFVFWLGR